MISLRLDDEDSEDDLKLVTGTHGIGVPSACTIVIIAGITSFEATNVNLRKTL